MNLFQKLFSGTPAVDLGSMINDGTFLVDVRTPGEFSSGNVRGSVNIPLDSIPNQLSKFKNKKSVIVFCRSGNRSGQAKSYLEQNGITNVINGGTWEHVNQFVK
jgi:rhodanese-related sulfurtransferase